MEKNSRHLNLLIAALTALYLLILATRPSEYFFGPSSWQWHGRPPAASTYERWWPAMLLLGVYFLGAGWWWDRRLSKNPSRRAEWAGLLFLLLLAPAIQLALKYIHYPDPIEFYLHRTIGPHNGFWQIAIGIDNVGDFLQRFPEEIQAHPFVHTVTHPPGNFLYIWLWRKLFALWPEVADPLSQLFRSYNCADLQFVRLNDAQIGAASAQMLIPFFSSLTAIPLYFLGKQLGGARAGFRSSALFLIVPSFTLFTMRWDQLYPVLWVSAVYLFHRGLGTRRLLWFFLSGLPLSVATFMSFGNATLIVLLALYALVYFWWRDRQPRPHKVRFYATAGVLFFLGVSSVWVGYQALTGNSLWDVFATAMETHLFLGRSYWVWLGYNLYDFVTFVGIPVAVLLLAAAVAVWRETIRTILARRRRFPRGAALTLALSSGILLLDLSGVSLGEVGRLWLPWMALACLVAALWLARGTASYKMVLGLMLVQTLSFTLFLRASATGMPDYSPRSPRFDSPSPAERIEVTVGDSARLVGYSLDSERLKPGEALQLSLYWQAKEQADRPYTVFVHLVDQAGQIQAQQDNMPRQNSLPTTCWQRGEYIVDPYTISLAEDVTPGTYTIQIGMYYLPTGKRLPVGGADAEGNNSSGSLRLTDVQVIAASPNSQ